MDIFSGAVAAQTAGEKIRQMFTLPMESVGMAIVTYAGQNFGVGKLKRIRQGMGYSFHAIISGVWELAGRSLGGWLAIHGVGFTAVCLANPLAWIFALCYCICLVRHFLRKNERKQDLT